jgi:HTH-type transcriptional repressor of NAD biosynthesis genes
VDFVQDGTRSEEIASDREKYSQQIKNLLDKNNVTYTCISGNYYERFTQAKKILEKIGLTTIW